jgi:hypothetical protein
MSAGPSEAGAEGEGNLPFHGPNDVVELSGISDGGGSARAFRRGELGADS